MLKYYIFSCSFCSKVFKAEFSLGQHLRSVHKDQSNFSFKSPAVSISADTAATISAVDSCSVSRTVSAESIQPVLPVLDDVPLVVSNSHRSRPVKRHSLRTQSCDLCGFKGDTMAQGLHFDRAHRRKSVAFVCPTDKHVSYDGHSALAHDRSVHGLSNSNLETLRHRAQFIEYYYIPTCSICHFSSFNDVCLCPSGLKTFTPLNKMAGSLRFDLDVS